MIIPEGVNQIEFYKAATLKGISIRSKYKGVYVHYTKGVGLRWLAKKVVGVKHHTIGAFPFTHDGELRASQAYERFIIELTNTPPTVTK